MLGERSVMACERSRRNTHEGAAQYIYSRADDTPKSNKNFEKKN
jgi:hypothetical protein